MEINDYLFNFIGNNMDKKALEDAMNTVTSEYLSAVLTFLSQDDSLDEISYFKKSIEMPNGGIYVLMLQHVTGPKLSLKSITGSVLEEKEST